ncbi:glycosyl hydrolase [Sphingobium sp. Cam5-1]|uniref:glycosyl hydrolase n=1 Tax=Sphingobium sp. Cam5-1 TaxID=2789327 RepID=UPI0018AD0EC1|nr:glycosyl hydrolase [Sphingobium sp. Cam5-1]QPI75073.1 hypothetical protein IZV00_15350 [Sphingobium sp. Cam5-1]
MMRGSSFTLKLALMICAGHVSSAIAQNASGAPSLNADIFRNPPASVRPIYRWWLPLAAVEEDELRREIDQMVQAGAGGVEIAAMPVPGETGSDPAFLKDNGFGSSRWSRTLETIFDHAGGKGLRVDVMVGPHWPTSVPSVSSLDDPAAQQQLVAGYARIAPGQRWTAALPLPAKSSTGADTRRTLVAVLAARCATDACPETGGTRMIDRQSVQDLTAKVAKDGTLSWNAPAGADPWWVIALYQVPDGQKLENLSASTPNYVIDHIGPAGARAVTDFYDRSILTPRLRSLIRTNKSSLFEDSFEPSEGLKWTSTFLAEFKRRRGYSLTPYLPLLVGGGVGARKGFFDYADTGERVREDYRQTFSDLYGDNHMKPYARWAHGVGMTTRLQVEGGPMEIADLAALPDIPEGENRNFLNNPELFKVIGTGAQLRLMEAPLSTECCPIQAGTWATTAGGKPFTIAQGTGAPFGQAGNDANLNWVYKAYAGGVNQLVWHGFPYIATPEGSGVRSRWPGNSFDGNKEFSEAFGPRMPQWPDYRLINDHLARLQLVMRQGRPRYDIAVFWHDFGVKGIAPNVTAFTGYPGLSKMPSTTSPLAAAGFTHQYVSPSYLTRSTARDVRNAVWMPHRMGFKAILLNDQAVMPVDSLRRIRDVARLGVPLIIAGRVPERTPGLAGKRGGDAELARLVAELRTLAQRSDARVRFVADEAEASVALAGLGVEPAAARAPGDGSSDILTVRRQTADTDYYLLFNQGTQTTSETLSFAGTGIPFELNSWTGEILPLGLYEQTGGAVRIPITLAANDVKLIGIGRPLDLKSSPAIHAVATTGHTIGSDGAGLVLRADRSGHFQTKLSNGKVVQTRVQALLPPMPLDRWTLGIESWTADHTGLPGLDHTRRQRLPDLPVKAGADHSLPGWSALGHPDKAGRGFYTADIQLPASWSKGDGAWLDLGQVVDTFRLTVNGMAVPPSSYQDTSRIDIGPLLRAGANRIEVRVATPLRNAVEAATKEGAKMLKQVGLIGPVILRPYRDVALGR